MQGCEFTFSVFTPTYNRAGLLDRPYESLRAQSFQDFEWLIVDDGSTDGTAGLVRQWQQAAPFPIHYVYQPNAGKHVAINRGAQEARGELFLFLDSDDAFVPNALERYLFHWNSIPAERREQFSGVSALAQDPAGRVVGSCFPTDPTDSDSLEIRFRYGVTGEKRGFQRVSVMRAHPFPQFEHETVLAESVVWNQIALRYKTRYVNEALTVYYDTAASLSANRFLARARNPLGSRHYYLSLLRTGYPFPRAAYLKSYANYVRFSLHAGIGIRQELEQAPSALHCLLAWPLGAALYLRDRQDIRPR